jgi:hypothetical protein
MEPLAEPMHTAWPFPFVPQDWEHTPAAVQAYVQTLHDELTRLRERVEALEARLKANSTTSHRPPSSDSPYKKPRQHTPASPPRKAGGKPGHAGHRQVLLPPTAVHDLRPERCPCGNPTSLNLSGFVAGRSGPSTGQNRPFWLCSRWQGPTRHTRSSRPAQTPSADKSCAGIERQRAGKRLKKHLGMLATL